MKLVTTQLSQLTITGAPMPPGAGVLDPIRVVTEDEAAAATRDAVAGMPIIKSAIK